MTAPGSGFLDIPQVSADEANVIVVSFPFEGTVSYGTGTAQGPSAILTASRELESFDEELAVDVAQHLRIAALSPLAGDTDETPESYLHRVEQSVAELTPDPPFVLGLGGEHSLTPAILAGLAPDPTSVTVVQIDAHADLRDQYLGTPHSHACAMARVLDLGVRELHAVGIRSTAPEEFERAQTDPRIHTWYDHQLQSDAEFRSLLESLRGIVGPVYLTIDVDGLDPVLTPGTGTPQPGGLGWYQALSLLRTVLRESDAEVFGADIMETAPQPHSQVSEITAAKLALKILAYRFVP